MISIIICSINKVALAKVVENITDTIGVSFEIIVIENTVANLGICAAYNQGAAQSKYDIYCFMHEDIFFETFGWGQKVINHLKSSTLGLIGLAGGTVKSRVPSSWAPLICNGESNFIQHFKKDNSKKLIYKTATPTEQSIIKNVVCIDGFWMCTKKDIFKKYPFDEKTFTGFHGYDTDFSLQVFDEYEVAVIFDVMVHHYSEGSFDKLWLENAILVSDKWKKKLPVAVTKLSKEILVRQHWTAMHGFLDKLVALNYSLPQIVILFIKFSINKYFYWRHFLYFLKYIFYKYFKKI